MKMGWGVFGICAVVWGVALTGCADAPEDGVGTGFAGAYETVARTRNVSGCDKEGSAHAGDRYFELREAGATLDYYRCLAPGNCTVLDAGLSFDTHHGAQWSRVEVGVEPGRESCRVQLSERTAEFADAQMLRIEGRVWAGTLTHAVGEACDEAMVLARRDELTCTQRDALKARPLPKDGPTP